MRRPQSRHPYGALAIQSDKAHSADSDPKPLLASSQHERLAPSHAYNFCKAFHGVHLVLQVQLALLTLSELSLQLANFLRNDQARRHRAIESRTTGPTLDRKKQTHAALVRTLARLLLSLVRSHTCAQRPQRRASSTVLLPPQGVLWGTTPLCCAG